MTADDAELEEIADGIWVARDPVRIVGMSLTTTMTILRLSDGTLLVYSPVELTEQRRVAVQRLGSVTHVYAPNLFHHLHVGGWMEAFPDARLHAPMGLGRKRPDLRPDRVHGSDTASGFSDTIEEIPIGGCRLGESALFYRPNGTLLVADLVHNVGRPAGHWTKTYTRLMGFHDRVALSRALRWTAFSDRKAARASVDRLLELPFDRIVVGHGSVIGDGARDALSEAFDWLPGESG